MFGEAIYICIQFSKQVLRYLFSILVLFALVAQTFSTSFIVLDYYSHTAKYEKNCINKARPQMKCHGHCQMMKKILEEEKKEQQNPEQKTVLKLEVLSSRSFFAIIQLPHRYEISNLNQIVYTSGKSIDRSFDIFHPPQC